MRAGSRNFDIIITKGSYANTKTALPDTSSRQQRLRDGQDSAPDLATSCLRSYAQYKILFKKKSATWLLYRVLYSVLVAVVSATSLTLAPECQAFH